MRVLAKLLNLTGLVLSAIIFIIYAYGLVFNEAIDGMADAIGVETEQEPMELADFLALGLASFIIVSSSCSLWSMREDEF